MVETPQLSRRSFLRLGVGVTALAPMFFIVRHADAAPLSFDVTPARYPLGRAIVGGLVVRDDPSTKAKAKARLKRNQVVDVLGQTTGSGTYNKIWYQIQDGWVHSGLLQPCKFASNETTQSIPKGGAWAELTVPVSAARRAPAPNAAAPFSHYFGNVFRVISAVEGTDAQTWYRVTEGTGGVSAYIRGEHARLLTPADFAPISSDVPVGDKRIEVNLRAQTMTAFERDQPVFNARIASGRAPYYTNVGRHRIWLKTAGQRMTGGAASDDSFYDLPGISWVSYFTASGEAFHGTYWHNDYGAPRSHGCVNLLPEDARWVFLWSTPVVSLDQRRVRSRRGAETTVLVR